MIHKDHTINTIPNQPPVWVSYLVSGKLTHLSTVLFILESIVFWKLLQMAIYKDSMVWIIVLSCCFGFAFIHIFLVMADGWSRFQDYKRAKDQLFLYGFQERIIMQYSSSQCQRAAFTTAASELGFKREVKTFFHNLGYRWYHIIPDFMVKDPFFFYKPYFWKRTFLEKNYTPKFNYHQLYMELQLK